MLVLTLMNHDNLLPWHEVLFVVNVHRYSIRRNHFCNSEDNAYAITTYWCITQFAKMSIDHRFIELKADEFMRFLCSKGRSQDSTTVGDHVGSLGRSLRFPLLAPVLFSLPCLRLTPPAATLPLLPLFIHHTYGKRAPTRLVMIFFHQ